MNCAPSGGEVTLTVGGISTGTTTGTGTVAPWVTTVPFTSATMRVLDGLKTRTVNAPAGTLGIRRRPVASVLPTPKKKVPRATARICTGAFTAGAPFENVAMTSTVPTAMRCRFCVVIWFSTTVTSAVVANPVIGSVARMVYIAGGTSRKV